MKPLEGMKIVEIANFVAAPASSRLLADWGADVIKIEALSGDPNRFMGTLNRMPGEGGANPTFDTTAR
jgi:crotonobetainyl-CoA:carnitine CoA-transferase CaiB-like acyl-CoA transferase